MGLAADRLVRRTSVTPRRGASDFQDADDVNAPAVAIVSASLARQVRSLDPPRQTHVSYEFAGTTRTVTVIGVVDDVLNKSLLAPPKPTLYIPFFQMPFANMTSVASVADSAQFDWAQSTTRAIGDTARVVDPAGTTSDARTLDSIVAAVIRDNRGRAARKRADGAPRRPAPAN